jgi:hypothetical protein
MRAQSSRLGTGRVPADGCRGRGWSGRRSGIFALLVLVLALSSVPASAASGSGDVPGPAFAVKAVAGPTVFYSALNGNDLGAEEIAGNSYWISVANIGSRPTEGPIVIRDQLPTGLTALTLSGVLDALESEVKGGLGLECNTVTVECRYDYPLQPGQRLAVVVEVAVAPGTVGPLTNSVLASGGGAPSASVSVVTAIGTEAESEAVPFGVATVSSEATGLNGLTDEQAGDHPYESTVSFSLNTRYSAHTFRGVGYATPDALKDVIVDVPPGFVGDPTVVPQCPGYLLSSGQCPPSTQIGFARIQLFGRNGFAEGFRDESYPVYNVVPSKGYPAEFVIWFPGLGAGAPLYASTTPDSGYGVRITTPGIPEAAAPTDISVTFFGTPANDPSFYNNYAKVQKEATPVAFLDNPVSCSTAPQVTTVSVDSWQEPGSYLPDGQPNLADQRWKSRSATQFPSLTGCELLQFDPSLTVIPDTTQADEASGFVVEQHFPQGPQQFPALISPELKETTVTLPSGVSLNPAAADGLEACSDAQIDLGSAGLATCPNGSQVGTIEGETPLLKEPLKGQIYLGAPYCDPCEAADAEDGNMFRIFLELEGSGVVVKQEGRIYANPVTGQLTTTFKNLPQLPASNFKLHFNNGLRSGLATPQACGTFTGTTVETPWSSPITPSATPQAQFNISWNGDGEACPAVWPFHPSFEAGTSNPNAGQYSPLTVTFNREDREQDFQQIQVTTPPGLVGSVAGVPLCGEPQADLGTCSEASQIGELTVSAGVGSHPFYQKGKIYLTGPYKGAPFGLSIVVPVHAGPFNLGNIVVRARITVNPVTTALTVTTDPLPQVIDGITLRVRKTNVTINRPGFIFNPTSCAQQKITATLSGSQGTQTEESAPFAVAGCAGLSFGPKFTVAVSGKVSRLDGTSFDAKVAFPPGPQSNIAHVRVELPRDLPSRLPTLQKACSDATFESNPAACPPASVIGAAAATTPILPIPLRGPVYFVSHGGEAFPNLVAVLQGYGVRVDLIGDTFISQAGITSSTFTNVPDVRVSSFELFLPAGQFSALTALGSPCKEKLALPTTFTAQDGTQLKQNVPIHVTGCARPKRAKRRRVKSARGHGKGRK